jgi:hypothetical protein
MNVPGWDWNSPFWLTSSIFGLWSFMYLKPGASVNGIAVLLSMIDGNVPVPSMNFERE